jgi:hypothetical protein
MRDQSKTVERARHEVLLCARVIAEADYGQTYPDLHKAFSRLDKAIASTPERVIERALAASSWDEAQTILRQAVKS